MVIEELILEIVGVRNVEFDIQVSGDISVANEGVLLPGFSHKGSLVVAVYEQNHCLPLELALIY
jgi:hypothetical protein